MGKVDDLRALREAAAERAVASPRKGRPRLEDRDKTLRATKPWVKAGMSERTWYRRQAEKRNGK